MRKAFVAASVMAASLMANSAYAATVGFTEGIRDLVAGTTALSPADTSSNPAQAFLVGSLGTGSGQFNTINVFGRIVDQIDNFAFKFSATSAFNVSFIFGGYTLDAGGTVNESGFVRETGANKTATFRLLQDTGSGFTEVDFEDYTTNVTSVSDNGGTPLIFSAGAGDWVVQIDGKRNGNKNGSGIGLYDISITDESGPGGSFVVPLPASALLLLGGLAGLGLFARRRS